MTTSLICQCQFRGTKASCTSTPTRQWTGTTRSIPLLTLTLPPPAWECIATAPACIRTSPRGTSTSVVLTGATKNDIILTETLHHIQVTSLQLNRRRVSWITSPQFVSVTAIRAGKAIVSLTAHSLSQQVSSMNTGQQLLVPEVAHVTRHLLTARVVLRAATVLRC